ncbi:MAG: hypothetical protein LBF24_02425 [Puniceicoccales bacterium]|jgi:hypothetical protein|nr:hypothetical protein [Puniceicoccales bacterium]
MGVSSTIDKSKKEANIALLFDAYLGDLKESTLNGCGRRFSLFDEGTVKNVTDHCTLLTDFTNLCTRDAGQSSKALQMMLNRINGDPKAVEPKFIGFIKDWTSPSASLFSLWSLLRTRHTTDGEKIMKVYNSIMENMPITTFAKMTDLRYRAMSEMCQQGREVSIFLRALSEPTADFWEKARGDEKLLAYVLESVLIAGSESAVKSIPLHAIESAEKVFLKEAPVRAGVSYQSEVTVGRPIVNTTEWESVLSRFFRLYLQKAVHKQREDAATTASREANRKKRISDCVLWNPVAMARLIEAIGDPAAATRFRNSIIENPPADFAAAQTPIFFFEGLGKGTFDVGFSETQFSTVLKKIFSTANGKQLSSLDDAFFCKPVLSGYSSLEECERWDCKEVRELYGTIPVATIADIAIKKADGSLNWTGVRLLRGVLQYGTADQLNAMTADQLAVIFERDFSEEDAARRDGGKHLLTESEKDSIRRSILCSVGSNVGLSDLLDVVGTGLRGQPLARISPRFHDVVRGLNPRSPICQLFNRYVPGDFWQFVSLAQIDAADGLIANCIAGLDPSLVPTISIEEPEVGLADLPDTYVADHRARNLFYYAAFFAKAYLPPAEGKALHDALTAPQLVFTLNQIKALESDVALRDGVGLDHRQVNLRSVLQHLTDEDFHKLMPYLTARSTQPPLDSDIRIAVLQWAFFRPTLRSSLDADQLVKVLNHIAGEECARVGGMFSLSQTTHDVLAALDKDVIVKLRDAGKLVVTGSDLTEGPLEAILQHLFFQEERAPLDGEQLFVVAHRIACSAAKLLPDPDPATKREVLDPEEDPYGLNQTMASFVDDITSRDAKALLSKMEDRLPKDNDNDADRTTKLRHILNGGERCAAPFYCAMAPRRPILAQANRQWWPSEEEGRGGLHMYKILFDLIEKAQSKDGSRLLAAFLRMAREENAESSPSVSVDMLRMTRMAAALDLDCAFFPRVADGDGGAKRLSLFTKALIRTEDPKQGSLFAVKFICVLQLIFFGFFFASIRAQFYLVCFVLKAGDRASFYAVMSAVLSSRSTSSELKAAAQLK